MEEIKRLGGFHTPAEIVRRMRIKIAPVGNIERWLEKYLNQKPLGRSVRSVLRDLGGKGADVVEVLERIHIDVFSRIPDKIPAWRRSNKTLSKRAKLLEDAAQALEENYVFDAPVFRDRDTEVYTNYDDLETAAKLRKVARSLRESKPLFHRPDSVKINESVMGLCGLLKKQTRGEFRNEVGYLVKAAFPYWQAGESLYADQQEPSLENAVKQILRRYRQQAAERAVTRQRHQI